MLLRRLAATLLAAAIMGAAGEAQALKFLPFIEHFAPHGPDSKKTYRVENDTAEPIAVQITMVRREMALDGSESLSDAEEDFVVFPPQLVLQPGEARSVRVQWLGEPEPEVELAYRIVVEQLPVSFESQPNQGPNVRILLRYLGALYIVPEGAASDVAVTGVEAVEAADGSRRLAITLDNRGNAHARIKEPAAEIASKQDATAVRLEAAQLAGLAGENVLARSTRRFLLPWPEGVTFGAVELQLDFSAGR